MVCTMEPAKLFSSFPAVTLGAGPAPGDVMMPFNAPQDAFEAVRFRTAFGQGRGPKSPMPLMPQSGGGIAPLEPARLLARHSGAVEVLRLAVGDENIFNDFALPVLFGWAALVQGLPAAASGPYAESTGLFLFGLHGAAAALHRIDASMLGRTLTPIKRKALAERIRIAALALALIRAGEALEGMLLEAGEADRDECVFKPRMRFDPAAETLHAFSLRALALLRANALFRLRWRTSADPKDESAGFLAAAILPNIAGPRMLRWLAESPQARSALLGCARGALSDGPAAAALEGAVQAGLSDALRCRAAETAARDAARPSLRAWAPVLIHAVKRLLLSGRWRINDYSGDAAVRSLPYAQDGLFIPWPEALSDLAPLAAAADAAPIFEDPALAAAILAEAGFALTDEKGDPVHSIRVPASSASSAPDAPLRSMTAILVADPAPLVLLAGRALNASSVSARTSALDEAAAAAHLPPGRPIAPLPLRVLSNVPAPQRDTAAGEKEKRQMREKKAAGLSREAPRLQAPAPEGFAESLASLASRPGSASSEAGELGEAGGADGAGGAPAAEAESQKRRRSTAQKGTALGDAAKPAGAAAKPAKTFWSLDLSEVRLAACTASALRSAVAALNETPDPAGFAMGESLFLPLCFFPKRSRQAAVVGGIDLTVGLLQAGGCLLRPDEVLEQTAAKVEGARVRQLPECLLDPVVRALPAKSAREALAQHWPNDATSSAPWGVALRPGVARLMRLAPGGRVTAAAMPPAGMLLVGLTGPEEGDMGRITAAVLRGAAGVRSPKRGK